MDGVITTILVGIIVLLVIVLAVMVMAKANISKEKNEEKKIKTIIERFNMEQLARLMKAAEDRLKKEQEKKFEALAEKVKGKLSTIDDLSEDVKILNQYFEKLKEINTPIKEEPEIEPKIAKETESIPTFETMEDEM